MKGFRYGLSADDFADDEALLQYVVDMTYDSEGVDINDVVKALCRELLKLKAES